MASPFEAVFIEHLPSDYGIVACVFKDVQNPGFLHTQLLDRNTDFQYAFLDASLVVSRVQVLAATYKAINTMLEGSLKTPNVHSEIVVALSGSNNIADAYRRFGISPSSRELVVVKVLLPTLGRDAAAAADTTAAHLKTNIQGVPMALTDATISNITDWAKVKKYYKLNGLAWLDKIPAEEQRKKAACDLVLSTMALRGI